MKLSRWGRFWLWEFERGSVPYDVVCLLLALLILLVDPAWLRDPMAIPR